VSSVGTILAALGLYTASAWSAGLFYLLQSTLVFAGLFLLSELVASQRGAAADRLEPAAPVLQPVLLGLLLLLAAASAAGLPPLPGFVGKLMILKASIAHDWQALVWTVVLLVGFISLLSLARAGNVLFWHVLDDQPPCSSSGASPRLVLAALSLLGAAVAMSVYAAPLMRYTDAASLQLLDRTAYAEAVLAEQGGMAARTARPYRLERLEAPTP
jgi:multicomponent K+:H+ antiporter subunit D